MVNWHDQKRPIEEYFVARHDLACTGDHLRYSQGPLSDR
jgi:hypothetical protein